MIWLNNLTSILELKANCEKIQEKKFEKGATITSYLEKRKQIFILLEGEACLIRFDDKGNKDIIDFFNEGNVFGEAFYNVNLNSELSVQATKTCKVLVINYEDVIKKCKQNCKFHDMLNSAFLDILFQNTKHQNSRIEVLSKRTIREKLHIYFEILSAGNFSNVLTLPFSLTDLADFLSVNRSAMMRELKDLEDEGFIQKQGRRKIKLLYK